MSKILVVEPHKMLQQAIGLSFFPDHEVRFADNLPDSDAAEISGYDAVVLDAAALRERNNFSAQTVHAVQNWKIPTIWLEAGEAAQAPSREKCVVLQRPVAKDRLLAALAECLGIASKARATEGAAPPVKEAKEVSGESTQKTKTHRADHESRIIELVDVVEEPPSPKKKKPPKQK